MNEQEKPQTQLEPNIKSALAYIPIIGVIWIITEKKDKTVRFHAFQSLFLVIAFIVLNTLIRSLEPFMVGYFLSPILSFGEVALWLYLMWKAYNKEMVLLPVIGKMAQEQAEKVQSEK